MDWGIDSITRRWLSRHTGKRRSRTATARKVVAHGPMWIYVAIAVGMDKEGTESPFMVVQSAGTYGSEKRTKVK